MCRGRAKLRINLKLDRLVSLLVWPHSTFRIANIVALMRFVFNFVLSEFFVFYLTIRVLKVVVDDAFFLWDRCIVIFGDTSYYKLKPELILNPNLKKSIRCLNV